MYLSTLIGLHKNLYWLASTKYEFNDIKREFSNVAKKIFIARDLTPYFANLKKEKLKKRGKTFFKIIFLSRISPMKNLDFLIKVLSRVKKNIVFNIYGPKEDLKYWKKCQILLANLPINIKVNIHDAIPNEKVINIFSQNDLFVFPTQGEAFGHIILEALLAATPVLLSDQTSWQTDKDKGLQTIPLYEDHWLDEINKYIEIPKREFILRRRAAYNYAKRVFLENLKSIDDNKKLFYKAIMENY
jgi:glycosyltransferase involved in cell wall biosynthesis